MKVDVTTEIVIDRPVSEVSAYAADPDNAPEVVRQHQVCRVEDLAAGPAGEPGRVRRPVPRQTARLHLRDRRTQSRPAAGDAHPGRPVPDGDDVHLGRRVTNRDPDDAAQRRRTCRVLPVAAPVMSMAMRRANRKDLANLKAILERDQPSP